MFFFLFDRLMRRKLHLSTVMVTFLTLTQFIEIIIEICMVEVMEATFK